VCAGRKDKPIIRKQFVTPISSTDQHAMGHGIKSACCLFKSQMDANIKQLLFAAMGEVMPVGDFPAQIKWQATDAIVGGLVGYYDRDVG
jgi:hypothetical protein